MLPTGHRGVTALREAVHSPSGCGRAPLGEASGGGVGSSPATFRAETEGKASYARGGFRVPLVPVPPVLSALACSYLMVNLPAETWIRFGVWMVLGVAVYVGSGRRRFRFSAHGAAERGAAAGGPAAGHCPGGG